MWIFCCIFAAKMKKLPQELFPVISNTADFQVLASYQDEIKVGEISRHTTVFPDYYKSSDYILVFIQQGTITATFNNEHMEIHAPATMYISTEHVLHMSGHSADLKLTTVSFNHRVAEDLHIRFPVSFLQHVFIRPATGINEEGMQVAEGYIRLLTQVVNTPLRAHEKPESKYETILHLLRSLISYLVQPYSEAKNQAPLSRGEEITGRFLALVESHSKEHHTIEWYADELCLTPKYMANVIKEVTGRSAGEFITTNLAMQAKSLLRSTTLSIQEISDRLGFQNQSHFGTFVKRHTGLSPKAFREQK